MKDLVGWTWDDLQVHVEDDLRTGAFMFFQPVFTNRDLINSLPEGSTIVEAGEGFVLYYEPEEDTENTLIHTLPEHPFCEDMDCPCHEDEDLKKEYLVDPWQAGHLAEKEAERLYRGEQIR